MLSLSDRQMDLVMRGAMLMPTHDRDVFLRSIASRLDGEPITDTNVEEAVLFILGCRGIGGGPLALHDAEPTFPITHRSTEGGHNGHQQPIPFARRPLRSQRR
jgi:hypothetical protein